MNSKTPHCLVIGVGPGTGLACARRFADGGYSVSLLARHAGRMESFAAEIDGAAGYAVDIADFDAFRDCLNRIVDERGLPDVVIYNAALATFGAYTEIATDDFERNFRVNAAGLLVTAQVFGPAMTARGHGALMVTGNTGSPRGKPDFVGWSPSKAAQRILAESLARELGPHGVHVAYIVIDAIIDMPFARRRRQEMPDEVFAKPADIADEIFHVAHQPPSTRSFLVELRPFGEKW